MVFKSVSDDETRGSTGVAAAIGIATLSSSERTNNVVKTFDAWKTCLLKERVSNSSEKRGDVASDSSIPKGCQFSPDGTCLLTARSNKLELYNTPFQTENDDGEDNNDSSGGSWEPVLTCHSGETVRSYAWYPHMKSSDPASCCFLGVSRDSPVHLYDAYDGSIRATYRPFNGLDEMESPTTLCFVANGQQLVTGGLRTDRLLHVFDVNRPGREHASPLLRLGKTRRSRDGQKGLVSAMAYSERSGVLAVGTYSPGSIYLYDLRTYSRSAVAEIVMSSSASTSLGGTVCVAGHGKKKRKNKRKRFNTASEPDASAANSDGSDGHEAASEDAVGVEASSSMNFNAAKAQWYQNRTRGGVTQVQFETDTANGGGGGGHYLFSTSRRSNRILQWDLRKLSSSNFCPGIASFETNNDTNQRIEFEVRGDRLLTGGTDGCVRLYSYKRPPANALLAKVTGFGDCVNGVSLRPDGGGLDSKMTRMEQLLGGTESSNESEGGESAGASNNKQCPESVLAVAIGRRHFPSETDWDDDNAGASLTNRTKHVLGGSIQLNSLRGP